VSSGTAAYYSFDYGNIHFICLDFMEAIVSKSVMFTWLGTRCSFNRQRLENCFLHHPPYTKGSHDSDIETELVEMRERALPILEDAV